MVEREAREFGSLVGQFEMISTSKKLQVNLAGFEGFEGLQRI